METLSLPEVTEDNLKSFHAKHFATAPVPRAFFVAHSEDIDDDDDGLGWYADGMKRHLTDEQIQIFRHSEIHRLSRERELLAESQLDQAAEKDDTAPLIPTTSQFRNGQGPGIVAPLSGKPEQSQRGKKRRNKKKQYQKQHQHAHSGLPAADQSRNNGQSHLAEKRKWTEYVDDDDNDNPAGLTHRRLARELDEQKVEPTELLYDD